MTENNNRQNGRMQFNQATEQSRTTGIVSKQPDVNKFFRSPKGM